jgi:UDP-N-acetylglucosamine 2-epimerase (non-hydrolysing)
MTTSAKLSKSNLLREDIPAEHIYVTGNTMIDALLTAAQRVFDIPRNALMLLIAERTSTNLLSTPAMKLCNRLKNILIYM